MRGESASLHARGFDRHSEEGLIEKLQRVPGKSVECGKLHLAAWQCPLPLAMCEGCALFTISHPLFASNIVHCIAVRVHYAGVTGV